MGRQLAASSPAAWQAPLRSYGVAATASVEEYESSSAAAYGEAGTIEVDGAAVADESLKIANCNLSPQTVQARPAAALLAGRTQRPVTPRTLLPRE